jgi:hypothetical protein
MMMDGLRVWNTQTGDQYGLTVDKGIETLLQTTDLRLGQILENLLSVRPLRSDRGVLLAPRIKGKTILRLPLHLVRRMVVKVWELYPILDLKDGLRSRSSEGRREKRRLESLQAAK